MKILAVSDVPSRSLENLVTKYKEKLAGLDLIVSCGDLDNEYLEFLVDGLDRDLLFVSGNHVMGDDLENSEDAATLDQAWGQFKAFSGKIIRHIAGTDDLHGRVQVFRNYIVVGFGGSRWYNGRGNQYTEKEMARVVGQVKRRIQLYRLKRKLLLKKPGRIIVLSHAPIFGVHDLPDTCHTGFKCFMSFLKKAEPLLWIHGHVHLPDETKNQVTLVGKTTVVNASGYKFITIEPDRIQVSFRTQILDK